MEPEISNTHVYAIRYKPHTVEVDGEVCNWGYGRVEEGQKPPPK